jgi:predicted RNA-binding Zn-ribbon protein involved in translation (DUF1610 family)
MGRIMKFSMDRLERRHLEVILDCPNCGSARIVMKGGNGDGHLLGKSCPKCGIEVILDGVNITVVDEAANGNSEPEETGKPISGAII